MSMTVGHPKYVYHVYHFFLRIIAHRKGMSSPCIGGSPPGSKTTAGPAVSRQFAVA